MSPWLLALVAGLVVAFVQYGWRDLRAGWARAARRRCCASAPSRWSSRCCSTRRRRARNPCPNWAALDASVSMARGDSTALARRARFDSRASRAESTFVFGDSARRGDRCRRRAISSSLLRPVVERALGAGHPLTVVTDGELDDPDAARSLPAGSRIVVLPHPPRRDLALSTIDVPRAVVSGDTVEVRVGVVAGSGGARAGTLDADARRQAGRHVAGRLAPARSASGRSRCGRSSRAPPARRCCARSSRRPTTPSRATTRSSAASTCRARRAPCSSRRRPISTRATRSPCCAARSAFRRADFFAWLRVSGGSKARSRPSPRARCDRRCATRRSRSFTATRRRSARRAP